MKLEIIKDVFNNSYIGVIIKEEQIKKYIDKMLELDNNFVQYNEKLLIRNYGHYHITVFNVAECKTNPDLFKTLGTNISNDLFISGVGSIQQDINKTFFIVVNSPKLSQLRIDNNLNDKDFHITIGFTKKDLFNDRKNKTNEFVLINSL